MYQPIANGASVTGWKAGQPVGVYTHFSGGTKPCRRRMTGSALVCPFCEANQSPIWRGYVPYYDPEYVRRFVLISEDHLEACEEIGHLSQIRISRAKGSRQPVVMSACNWRVASIPPSKDREQPVDLMPFLLKLWKDEELAKYASAQADITSIEHRDRHAVVPPAIEARRKSAAALPPEKRFVVKTDDELVPLSELLPNLSAMKNGKNGKHKPPG